MPREGTKSANLPTALADRIERILDQAGYRSRDEFVQDAVRRRLEELEKRGKK